jgi:TP901 family phage tail tape measure protein
MANTGGIRAGKAFVEIYADKTALNRGLKSISTDLKAFGAGVSSMGTKFMALGGGVVAPMLAAAKTFADVGSGLNDMSARTGMGTNALSELGFAAEQSGASLADVEIGVKRMQKAITAAKDGPLAGLKGMAPEKQFMAIAESLSAIQDPTARAAKAVEIFGRSGTMLIPMLGDVKALRAEAVRLGLSMGPQQAAAADALGDAWDSAKASFKAVAVAVGSALAPMLTGLAKRLTDGIAAVRQWVSENKALIINLFMAGATAVAAGAGLFILGKAIAFIGGVFSITLAIIKGAVATFGFLQAAVLLLANPFVLVGVAVAAVGAYFLYTSGAAGKAATFISEAFTSLLAEVTETFGVIAESMAAGDLVSAAKVGWALIQLEWQKGVAFITGLWEGFKGLYDEAVTGLSLGMINASAAIQTIWADLLNWMAKKWQEFGTSTFIETMAGWLAPIFARLEGVTTEEARKALTEDFAGARNAQPGKLAAMDAATAAQKAKIEADRKAADDALAGDLLARGKGRDAKTKAAQDAVDAARAEWERAKGEARAKAAAGAERGGPEIPGMPALDLEAAGAASKTRGTFSGSAIAGLGVGGGLVKKLVDINARLLKIDEQMLQEQKRLTLEMVA